MLVCAIFPKIKHFFKLSTLLLLLLHKKNWKRMETCWAGQNLRCRSTSRIFVIVSCVLEGYLQNMKYECVEIGWNNGYRKPIAQVVVVRSLILWLFSRLGIIYTVQRRNKDNSDTKITQRLQVKHSLAAQVRFSVLWNYLSTIWTKTEQNTCYANLLVKFPLSPRPRSWTVFTWLWEPNRLHFKG